MISIVIPLYNKAHTIVNTLNTVINQTYKNFEVIIVNDGSTDNGVKVIKENFNDPRIKIINQNNAGVSAARNRGVDESCGEYIAFLDGDDEWHPEYLSTMYELIKKYPHAGLFLCAGLTHNADGSIGYRIASKYEGKKCVINFFENPEVFLHTSGTIVNKNLFYKTHRFIIGMRQFEDKLAIHALALLTQTVYCGIPLTKYNGGIPGQLTQLNRKDSKTVDSELLYFNMIMDDCYNAPHFNKFCPIFIQYNLRHYLKLILKQRNYMKLDYFFNHLSLRPKKLLNPLEIFIMKHHYSTLAVLWINFTKIRWRMRGYPYAGQKIKICVIDNKYLSW